MFTVYSKPGCPACDGAKKLLESKSLPYKELILDVGQVKDMTKEYTTVEALKKRVPNARTVPQIFDGDILIGGFDSLQLYIGK
jgi:glutaredoxin 3